MLVGHPGLPSAHWARFRAASRARDMPSALENLRAQFDLSPVDLSQVRHPTLGSCCLCLGLGSRCDVVERGQDVVAIARGHNRALPNAQCVGGHSIRACVGRVTHPSHCMAALAGFHCFTWRRCTCLWATHVRRRPHCMKRCPSRSNAATRPVSRFACHSSRSSMLVHTTPACVIPDAQWRLGIAVYHSTKLTVVLHVCGGECRRLACFRRAMSRRVSRRCGGYRQRRRWHWQTSDFRSETVTQQAQ